MGVLQLAGSIVAGPQSGTTTFPSGSVTVPLASTTTGFAVATGVIARSVDSPGAYIALQGVGATDTVTKGVFLYLRTNADVLLRLTDDDGFGGAVVQSDLPVSGTVILEFPSTRFLRLLEIKGTAQIEYFIAGQE